MVNSKLDFLHFYPRPPRGGRQIRLVRRIVRVDISTHALREEGDKYCSPRD